MPSVLLVHRDAQYRAGLARELVARGFEILGAESIDGALEVAARGASAMLVEMTLLQEEDLGIKPRLDLRAGRPVRILALKHKATAEEMSILKRHGAGLLARPVEDLERLCSMLRIQEEAPAPWESKPETTGSKEITRTALRTPAPQPAPATAAPWDSRPSAPPVAVPAPAPVPAPVAARAPAPVPVSVSAPVTVPAPVPVPVAARAPAPIPVSVSAPVPVPAPPPVPPAPVSVAPPPAPVQPAVPAMQPLPPIAPAASAPNPWDLTTLTAAASTVPVFKGPAPAAPAAPPAPDPVARTPATAPRPASPVPPPAASPAPAAAAAPAPPPASVPAPAARPQPLPPPASISGVFRKPKKPGPAISVEVDDEDDEDLDVSGDTDPSSGGEPIREPSGEFKIPKDLVLDTSSGEPEGGPGQTSSPGWFADGKEGVASKPAGPCVLIVDDEPEFRNFLRDALASQGYQVHTAINGPAALRVIRVEGDVDLVICDLHMPHMDGFEVKHEIDMMIGRPMPFLIVTADASEEKIQTAAELGAQALIAKPIEDLDAFYAIVLDTLRESGVVPKE